MDYNPISLFLERFKKLVTDTSRTQKIIKETIEKHIGVEIQTNSLKAKGTSIYITGSPMLRSEVLVHKQAILKDIKESLPQSHFSDIR